MCFVILMAIRVYMCVQKDVIVEGKNVDGSYREEQTIRQVSPFPTDIREQSLS